MPIAPDPGHAGRSLLLGPDGRPVARFVAADREGAPVADLLEPVAGAPVEAIVAAAGTELRGWRVAATEAVGRALVQAGASPVRHSHVLSRDLRREPAPPAWSRPPAPAGVVLGPVDRPAEAMLEAYGAAYPPEHPDFRYQRPPQDLHADLAMVLDGRAVGPLLACSRLAVTADGAVAGAALVTRAPGEPPFGGPWLAQLFRHPAPALRGTGRALLQSTLAAATAEGLPTVGLAVSEGNPALRLYRALGMEPVLTAFTVQL